MVIVKTELLCFIGKHPNLTISNIPFLSYICYVKSFLSIVLVALLFLPLWGTFGYLTVQKKQVQKSVKRQIMKGIDREELIFMAFSQEELQTKLNWKHAKEFELNGEMYDIVERNETLDSAFYWVWWDNDETELNRRVNRIAAAVFGSSPQQHEQSQVVQHFYQSLFVESMDSVEKMQHKRSEKQLFQYCFSIKETSHTKSSPPPKLLF